MTNEKIDTFWTAIYTDGTQLSQYKENGSERLFKEIEEYKLFEFQLYHYNRILSFFPQTGTFGINGLLYNTDISNLNIHYRLIHFTRRRKVLGNGGKSTNVYYIGFQTTINGINHKRLISVCEGIINFENNKV